MVEGAALEMLFRGDSNEGSNPSLSVLIAWSKFGHPALALDSSNLATPPDS